MKRNTNGMLAAFALIGLVASACAPQANNQGAQQEASSSVDAREVLKNSSWISAEGNTMDFAQDEAGNYTFSSWFDGFWFFNSSPDGELTLNEQGLASIKINGVDYTCVISTTEEGKDLLTVSNNSVEPVQVLGTYLRKAAE